MIWIKKEFLKHLHNKCPSRTRVLIITGQKSTKALRGLCVDSRPPEDMWMASITAVLPLKFSYETVLLCLIRQNKKVS